MLKGVKKVIFSLYQLNVNLNCLQKVIYITDRLFLSVNLREEAGIVPIYLFFS